VTMKECTDKPNVVELLKLGDAPMFAVIVKCLHGKMVRVAASYVKGQVGVAEEVV
jgi:hypothetical protein